jgi:hypothetical protein
MALSHFSLLILIRLEGRIFLSPERSKLCFQALEIRIVPQNYLPCRELEKPSEVRLFAKVKNAYMMNENNNKKHNNGGRKPKMDPSIHRHVFRLTEEENAKLLSIFEASGMTNKAKFIISLLFAKEIKTVKIDKGTVDFYMRLTSYHSQFRSIGVNYNQIVKLLYRNFSEKKAAAYLYKLEKQTIELAVLCQKIIQIAQEFEDKHLKKHH